MTELERLKKERARLVKERDMADGAEYAAKEQQWNVLEGDAEGDVELLGRIIERHYDRKWKFQRQLDAVIRKIKLEEDRIMLGRATMADAFAALDRKDIVNK
jgi:hypothetical protein